MKHTTNTKIIFADSVDEAKKEYLALGLETEDPNAVLECYKAIEEEDFELDSDFNFVGEISVSPSVMDTIRQDPERAYVLYYIEDVEH